MTIIEAIIRLRDDLKTWVANNIRAKTEPISAEVDILNELVGDTSVADQISTALDAYSPEVIEYDDIVGAPNILDDGSGEILIQDNSGNVIMKVDESGVHTTAVSLNGVDVETSITSAVSDIAAVSDLVGDTAVSTQISAAIDEITYDSIPGAPSIVEDGSGEIFVQDEVGNVILLVDENGVHATAVDLNGMDVQAALDAATAHYVASNPHGLNYEDVGADQSGSAATALVDAKAYTDEKEQEINSAITAGDESVLTILTTHAADSQNPHGVNTEQIGAATKESLSVHTDNADIHVQDGERAKWNAKSDFSGSYNDLTDTPNITDDGTGTLYVQDGSGNTIFAVDEKGVSTTAVSLNGNDVETMIGLKADELALTEHTNDETNPHKVNYSQVGADKEGSATQALTEAKAYTDTRETSIRTDFAAADKTVSESLSVHTDNADIHVQDGERAKWNAKSDFSGSYNDLTDTPNINDNGSGDFTVSDNAGNVIMSVTEDGVTAYAYRNKDGADLEEMIGLSMERHLLGENPHSVTAAQVGAPTTTEFGTLQASVSTHTGNTDNPHGVTAEQVGAPSTAEFEALGLVVSDHEANTSNPHNVTADQVSYGSTDTVGQALAQAETNIGKHMEDVSNPHEVTCEQIGAVATSGGTINGDLNISDYLTLGADGVGPYLTGGYSSDGVPRLEVLGSEGDEAVRLAGIATPKSITDAANKRYVDDTVVSEIANHSHSELNYMSGVTSNVQEQIDNKLGAVFSAGTTAPSDTRLLWIDTTASTGGLKYYSGTEWIAVPVLYS